MLNKRQFVGALGAALAAPKAVWAQPYPSKPITIVVGYSAGGSSDLVARKLAVGLQKRLGQSVVVENRPGGNVIIAAQYIANARPDGYTIFLSTSAPYSMNPTLYRKLPYDPETAYSAISVLCHVPQAIQVPGDSAHASLRDYVRFGRENRGKLNYGSAGSASQSRLEMEMFNTGVGIEGTHIGFQGSAPAFVALMSAQVDSVFTDTSGSLDFIKTGKIRALALASDQRLPSLPDVPTLAEAGFPDLKIPAVWFGLFGPPKLPQEIVAAIAAAAREEMGTAEMAEFMGKFGIVAMQRTAAEMGKLIRQDAQAYGAVIERLNLKLD